MAATCLWLPPQRHQQLRDGKVQNYLNHTTEDLASGFTAIAEEAGVSTMLQGLGG
jgi:hypothetical protein